MHVYLEPINGYLACQICGAAEFARREIKMTTTGMTFLELDWLNRYHAQVLEKLGPSLEGGERAWLEQACAPL